MTVIPCELKMCCVIFSYIFVGIFIQDARSSDSSGAGFYKAAVYEHAVILPDKKAGSYSEALKQMMPNLVEYKKQAEIAGRQNVDIIVFPEVGITGFGQFRVPSDIEPYLEYIPDPDKVSWTPCTDPDRFYRTKVQTFLSCLARNNSLYLVANYGDAQPCTSPDPNCPENGQYQYNTNIVYDRQGKLIARYHKMHLYHETQYQEPVVPERIYFDTEFGRFGTFICFDILFYDPAIPLIERLNITDVVFPTAWMDALPFFSAIGYHSAFAPAYNVNFLSANVHKPEISMQGSGIYTPDGAIKYYYDSISDKGRLLVGDIPIRKSPTKDRNIRFVFGNSELLYLKKHEFRAPVRKNWFNFVTLRPGSDNITVCQKGLCCFLSYEREHDVDNYAFGAFNGRYKNISYNLQMCILLKCASENNLDCGKKTFHASETFKFFNMKGNFSTPYVTPQIITCDNGSLRLPPLSAMKYDSNGMTGKAQDTPLLHATLVGRIYDELSTDSTSSSTAPMVFAGIILSVHLVLLVL